MSLFLNVLEKPELREKAVAVALGGGECNDQEAEQIVSDYLRIGRTSLSANKRGK